ncbi:MAG: peptide ABC transporter permease [Lachnospiraceae bacterium]|nr:peptide ABC transporter permease [Lachnospiraceae bacterium]
MKIFKFFITRIFFRKILIVISVLLLFFLSDYIVFTTARSTVSTFQGYNEMKSINQKGNYIANLDPNNSMDLGNIQKEDTQYIYDHLKAHNLKYAIFTDGLIIDLPNNYDMSVSFAYLNEDYYKLNKQFEISQGNELVFDYSLDSDDTEIPVLIGKGLSETYPLGSEIIVNEPALQKQVTLKVRGILKSNIYHSNMYSLNSKQYYNFSIVIPVNEDFLYSSDLGLQLQSLFDIILLQTSEQEIESLGEVLQNKLDLKFNFYTQEDNFEYYKEYYFHSLKIIGVITAILIFILTCLTVWNSLAGIRIMIKEFTINLFVGLSYSKLRKIFYGYYGIVFFINLIILFIITAFSRYGNWTRKDASFSTFGLFGIIGMDWLSLCPVLLFDIMIGVIIVEIMIWRIKKVPISLGVLQ